MKFIPYQGGQLAYQYEGRGPVVVLLHGFCENSMLWEDFSRDLIDEGYRVLLIDLPGFGQSDPGAVASIDYYAGAVKAVFDEMKLDRPVLVGHSMGGYTGLAFAELYPGLLRGLGLFHSHPYADDEQKKKDRLRQIEFIDKHGHEIYVKQIIPGFFPPGYHSSRPFDVDKMIHRASRGPVKGITNALEAMKDRPDRSAVLEKIDCPVLFIVGAEDKIAPTSYFQDMLPLPAQADIHLLDKVGHMGMIEARRKTQLYVRQFVENCFR